MGGRGYPSPLPPFPAGPLPVQMRKNVVKHVYVSTNGHFMRVFKASSGTLGLIFGKVLWSRALRQFSHVVFDLKPISPVELDSKGHFWKKRGKTRINNHKWSFYACFHGPPRIPWG